MSVQIASYDPIRHRYLDQRFGYRIYPFCLVHQMNELDRDRIEVLSDELLLAIQKNYSLGPVSRDRVYEALNALAFCAAWTIAGCDDPEALEFFSKALTINLKDGHSPEQLN